MQEATQAIQPRPSLDDFAAMLDETLGTSPRLEGSVMRGTVVGLDDDIVIVEDRPVSQTAAFDTLGGQSFGQNKLNN